VLPNPHDAEPTQALEARFIAAADDESRKMLAETISRGDRADLRRHVDRLVLSASAEIF
jgi:hypothetical protein